jgi:hypothetical protein
MRTRALRQAGKLARIHVAELQERLSQPPATNPLAAFQVDQCVTAGVCCGVCV